MEKWGYKIEDYTSASGRKITVVSNKNSVVRCEGDAAFMLKMALRGNDRKSFKKWFNLYNSLK